LIEPQDTTLLYSSIEFQKSLSKPTRTSTSKLNYQLPSQIEISSLTVRVGLDWITSVNLNSQYHWFWLLI